VNLDLAGESRDDHTDHRAVRRLGDQAHDQSDLRSRLKNFCAAARPSLYLKAVIQISRS
jgi:hypothetical protein